MEYNFTGNFIEPYFVDREIEFQLDASASRRRYYGFDADIVKGAVHFSKTFFKERLITSVKYQAETITQFDATDGKDSGVFRIGSITPSIALDFRDKKNKVAPRKGAYFGLSYELANPTLWSMSDVDFEVNYYKIVSRNKFYIPFYDWVIAISLAAGMEKNLATSLLFKKY